MFYAKEKTITGTTIKWMADSDRRHRTDRDQWSKRLRVIPTIRRSD